MQGASSSLFEIRNPEFSLEPIKGLLFDLDETLYFIPSGAQFDHYGRYLADFLPEEERQIYLEELRKAGDESSPIKVGRSFDPKTEWILEFDDNWRLKQAYTLEGKKVPQAKLSHDYPLGTLEGDIQGLIHLASGWAVPTTLAKRRGLVREHYRKAYLATRQAMLNEPDRFPLVAPRESADFFKRLSGQGYLLFVATNSDTEDAENVLTRLGIRPYFNKVYGEAKKPAHSIPLLKTITGEAAIQPRELLIVGDSVYNDLKDPKNLGCQTVLVERYPGQPLGFVDARVWGFEGFIALWNAGF